MSQSEFEKLEAAYTLRGVELYELREKVSILEEEITRLKALLKLQQERQFGKKSEVSPTPDNGQASGVTHVSSHVRRKKCGRQLDTSLLPRHTVIHDLPESEKICKCCHLPLHHIGQDVSEQLEIIPSRYCVIEHIRMKYGCRPCDSIVMAPKPPAPIPKAIAGASLLTDIILGKYQYHLPLYRQSKIMKSYGLDIPDNTLGNWVMQSGDGLLKVYDALWVILKNRYLQVDETPVKVLETNKKGYVWTYYAPHVGAGKGLVVFEFSETRGGTVALERLKPFTGLLQTDAYAGYVELCKREGIVGLGCFSHARRKFSEVVKVTGDRQGIGAEMIERMKPLYALEARMREMRVTFYTRKRLRQKIARPIIKDIYKWLRSLLPTIPPKSQLANAISYTLNQWPRLVAYCRHGMAEIDTNNVENKIRDIALGKKNWLFIGNKNSGKMHALFYSLVMSAVLNSLNPRVYIHYLLTKIHELRRGEIDPLTLLPDRIDCKALEQFAVEQIAFGKKIMNSS